MNVLQHMEGNTTPAHKFQCLARHIAHWNGFYRESWLTGEWQKRNGKESCDELRIAAVAAREVLIREVSEKKQSAKNAGRAAMSALRDGSA